MSIPVERQMAFDPLTAVHFHERDPGVRWTKVERVAIDLDRPLDSEKILTPNVVRLPECGYRMYYTGLGPGRRDDNSVGYILSARSDDGETWTKEEGVRVDVHPPHATSRTLCPDVIPLADGGFRMYFEARSEDRPSVVLSAVSADGLNWEPEPGMRFADDNWSYGSPRCIYIGGSPAGGPASTCRLYFHRYTYPFRTGLDAGNVIISAVSADGLDFEQEDGVRIAQETERETLAVYAPEVIRLGDGSYRMYYSGWGEEICGGVFSATSRDGLSWHKDAGPCIELGGCRDDNMVSEPCVIQVADGTPRVYYEARDEQGRCRILAARPST